MIEEKTFEDKLLNFKRSEIKKMFDKLTQLQRKYFRSLWGDPDQIVEANTKIAVRYCLESIKKNSIHENCWVNLDTHILCENCRYIEYCKPMFSLLSTLYLAEYKFRCPVLVREPEDVNK